MQLFYFIITTSLRGTVYSQEYSMVKAASLSLSSDARVETCVVTLVVQLDRKEKQMICDFIYKSRGGVV